MWLAMVIILFAVILHYSITLQYSAYFHIYFQIAQKYENALAQPAFNHLKKRDVLKTWFMGIMTNPFANVQAPGIDIDPLSHLKKSK